LALPRWQVCLVSKAKLINLIVPLNRGIGFNWKETQDILLCQRRRISTSINRRCETIGGNLSKAWFSLQQAQVQAGKKYFVLVLMLMSSENSLL